MIDELDIKALIRSFGYTTHDQSWEIAEAIYALVKPPLTQENKKL